MLNAEQKQDINEVNARLLEVPTPIVLIILMINCFCLFVCLQTHLIRMMNVPADATEDEVRHYFSPLRVLLCVFTDPLDTSPDVIDGNALDSARAKNVFVVFPTNSIRDEAFLFYNRRELTTRLNSSSTVYLFRYLVRFGDEVYTLMLRSIGARVPIINGLNASCDPMFEPMMRSHLYKPGDHWWINANFRQV